MAIDYPALLEQHPAPQQWSWDDRDAILYALCLGFGADPLDARRLAFVYERALRVVPTLPTVLAWIAAPTFAELGVDPRSALHGEQKIDIHRAIRLPVTVRTQGRVVAVYDKGAGRGAVVVTELEIADAADGAPLATLTTSCFGRAEGGCGGSPETAPKPHPLPERAPDHTLTVPTRPDLALLYRLTGDRNPLHADPAAAHDAGLPRPILHGLCSFGITCRAVLEAFADFDPQRIASHQARFVAPLLPGETLGIDLWRDGDVVSFRARALERNVVVLSNGRCALRS
jgi:acyl dehydratase